MITALLLLAGSGLFSEDDSVRVEALAEIQDEYPAKASLVPVLVDMIDDDSEPVREAAQAILAHWGGKALVEYGAFLADESGPSMPYFRQAGEKLTMLGTAVTPSDFAHVLGTTRPERLRGGIALCALAHAATPQSDDVLDVLAPFCAHENESVKAMAATSLALLGWGAVTDDELAGSGAALEKALESKVGVIQFAGVMIAGTVRARDDDTRHLLTLIGDTELGKYVVVKGVLEKLGVKEPAEQELKKGLAQAAEELAAGRIPQALYRLEQLGPKAKGMAPQLQSLFDKAKGDEAVEIGRVLVVLSPKHRAAVAKRFAELLAPDGGLGRYGTLRALEVLAQSGGAAQPAIPNLIEILGWRDPTYKKSLATLLAAEGAAFNFETRAKRLAVRTLGNLGAPAIAAKPDLRDLQKHADLRLRYLASLALRKLSD